MCYRKEVKKQVDYDFQVSTDCHLSFCCFSNDPLFPKHTTLTPIYLASFGFSPMILMYADRDIFEPGFELLSESYISNSIDMSIPTDILSLCGPGTGFYLGVG